MRILVVDDSEPWRQRVCSILQTRPEFRVVAEAVDGLEAVEKAQAVNPDAILLDLGLPNLNGLEAAKRIRQLAPKAKIVFLTQNRDRDVVRAAHRFRVQPVRNICDEAAFSADSEDKSRKFSRLDSLETIHHVSDATWITALVLSRDMHPQCGCSMVKSDRHLVMEA
jgi:chemotaxis response regulator CheB